MKWCFFYNSESFVRVIRAFRGYIFLRFSSFQGFSYNMLVLNGLWQKGEKTVS